MILSKERGLFDFQIVKVLPEGLASGPEGLRPLLLGGLDGSERRGSFLGGVADPRLPALLWGDREEELPEEDRERERLLVDKLFLVQVETNIIFVYPAQRQTDLRTGERLRLCLGGGWRLGGLLRLGEIRLLGLGLRRGENDLKRSQTLFKHE